MPYKLEGALTAWSLMGKPISPNGFFMQENLATHVTHIVSGKEYMQEVTEEDAWDQHL